MAGYQRFSRLRLYESTITIETVVVLAYNIYDFYVFEKKNLRYTAIYIYVLQIGHEKFELYDESHNESSNNATVLFIYQRKRKRENHAVKK